MNDAPKSKKHLELNFRVELGDLPNAGTVELTFEDDRFNFDFSDIPRGVAVALLLPAVQAAREILDDGVSDTFDIDLKSLGPASRSPFDAEFSAQIVRQFSEEDAFSTTYVNPNLPEIREDFADFFAAAASFAGSDDVII